MIKNLYFFSGTELFKNRVDIYSFGPVPLTEHDNLTISRIYIQDIEAKWATETIFLFPEKKGSKKQFSKKGREENVKLKHAACNEIRTIRKHTQA